MNFKKYHVSTNLFDKSTVLSDYYINDSNGAVSRNTSYNTSASMPIYVEGLKYIYPNTNGYTGVRQWAAFYNSSGNYISGFNGYNIAIKVPSNAKTVRFTVSNTYIDAFSVNVGSQPLPYEPYSSEVWYDIPHYIHKTDTDTITTLPAVLYPNDSTATVGLKGQMEQSDTPTPTTPIQPQECGERTGNLLNTANSTNGYLLADGSMTTPHANLYTTDYIAIPTGVTKITQSYNLGDPMLSPAMCFYDSSKTYISGEAFQTATVKTFEIPSGAVYFRTCYRTTFEWCMVNTGSTALPYEPYGVKIPISSGGVTTPVYLGEVQSTRQIKKLVFDGTENFIFDSTNTNRTICRIPLIDCKGNYGFCTHIFWKSSYESSEYNRLVWGIVASGGMLYISLSNEYLESQTLVGFKSYLAAQYANGTPFTIWYILAEPTTGILNEPIRKIGDYADEVSGISIPVTAGANTISIGTTLQPSEVTATYKGWHEASEIVHRYQYGEWDGSPTPTYPVYGFKIDKKNDDPDTRVTYLYDAEGMTPAYMDFSNGTFNYGSWANAWFIKNNRPVALKFDGTVDYELNHTDFTKKLDGTASDVEDVNYAGNFMSEMPTVYVKRWEDNDYNYMAFCEVPYDEDFLAQAHTNGNGTVNSAIYLPMFKGSVDSNNKMRSLMGTYPRRKTTGTNEVDYAGNCGIGWQIWDKAKIDLIMDLIVLITKSTNCKGKIGNGDCYTYNYRDTINYGGMKSGYETDITTYSANGQFYGSEGTEITNYGKHHMCAFYIEDLWGNRMDRCLGFNLVNNIYKVKMTPPYALETDNTYETLITPPLSSIYGWLLNISSSNLYGSIPTGDTAINATRGFCSYWYKQNSGNRLSIFGGSCNDKMAAGRYWSLYVSHDLSSWDIGASPCYSNPT